MNWCHKISKRHCLIEALVILQQKTMQNDDRVRFFLVIVLMLLLSLTLIISMTLNTHKILIQSAFASSSPPFQRQELKLGSGNWFDMISGESTRGGTSYIDIQSVSYLSNGRHLNATIWLAGFNVSPKDYELVDYGMYFDTDSNNETGLSGIDYKVEVSWDNKSGTWTRLFEEWSSSGDSKTLSKQENITDFFEVGASHVTLSADLDSMLSPNNYRVLFYAEGINYLQKQFSWIIDSTNWISVPSPELVFVISPSPIVLTQGGESIAEVRINSSSAEELELNINPYVTENSSNSRLITMSPDSEKLLVPPFGAASTHMRVSITSDTEPTDYMAIMRANITTLRTQAFAEPGFSQSETQENATNNGQDLGISTMFQRQRSEFVSNTITDEPVYKSSVFSIQVKEWRFDEQLNSFVNQWVTPLTTIYTALSSIVAGVLGWIYGRRRQRKTSRQEKRVIEDQDNKNNNN
jgi:hypothetical protein